MFVLCIFHVAVDTLTLEFTICSPIFILHRLSWDIWGQFYLLNNMTTTCSTLLVVLIKQCSNTNTIHYTKCCCF